MLKTTIPFAEVRFFDETPRRVELEQRFSKFLNQLRHAKDSMDPQSGSRIDTEDGFEGLPCALSRKDRLKISKRAAVYLNRVEGATGMQHLKDDDRKRLSSLSGGVVVSRVPTEHDADVLASVLHDEMPWMAPATEHIWHALRKSVRGDQPGFQFAPLLLLGSPGIGKSHWARRLGELLEVPTTVVDATGEPASFALVGSQRGWSNAGPGKIIESIVAAKCANPIIVVDEVEKAGEVLSNNGSRFSLTDALLPLLERMTASTWQCPYYRIKCDMSWVGWVLTANTWKGCPMRS
ncbi:hypothetical protein GGR95_003156 [Sulfitobacter undariae]|uniref:ATPase AAA-type core domain-containing protein n=1 Tax=Sulfitobacter undariae TaxID=1563671 RepID=A0A7W6E691_9RHOB|nr:hypothetical protein [Sulfitobacter undariae]